MHGMHALRLACGFNESDAGAKSAKVLATSLHAALCLGRGESPPPTEDTSDAASSDSEDETPPSGGLAAVLANMKRKVATDQKRAQELDARRFHRQQAHRIACHLLDVPCAETAPVPELASRPVSTSAVRAMCMGDERTTASVASGISSAASNLSLSSGCSMRVATLSVRTQAFGEPISVDEVGDLTDCAGAVDEAEWLGEVERKWRPTTDGRVVHVPPVESSTGAESDVVCLVGDGWFEHEQMSEGDWWAVQVQRVSDERGRMRLRVCVRTMPTVDTCVEACAAETSDEEGVTLPCTVGDGDLALFARELYRHEDLGKSTDRLRLRKWSTAVDAERDGSVESKFISRDVQLPPGLVGWLAHMLYTSSSLPCLLTPHAAATRKVAAAASVDGAHEETALSTEEDHVDEDDDEEDHDDNAHEQPDCSDCSMDGELSDDATDDTSPIGSKRGPNLLLQPASKQKRRKEAETPCGVCPSTLHPLWLQSATVRRVCARGGAKGGYRVTAVVHPAAYDRAHFSFARERGCLVVQLTMCGALKAAHGLCGNKAHQHRSASLAHNEQVALYESAKSSNASLRASQLRCACAMRAELLWKRSREEGGPVCLSEIDVRGADASLLHTLGAEHVKREQRTQAPLVAAMSAAIELAELTARAPSHLATKLCDAAHAWTSQTVQRLHSEVRALEESATAVDAALHVSIAPLHVLLQRVRDTCAQGLVFCTRGRWQKLKCRFESKRKDVRQLRRLRLHSNGSQVAVSWSSLPATDRWMNERYRSAFLQVEWVRKVPSGYLHEHFPGRKAFESRQGVMFLHSGRGLYVEE